jgi:hypothetical protein
VCERQRSFIDNQRQEGRRKGEGETRRRRNKLGIFFKVNIRHEEDSKVLKIPRRVVIEKGLLKGGFSAVISRQ